MATTLSRQQIADRIQQLLLREIGHEIDAQRLLAEPRYARDVLLVCDACPGGELLPLAALFRRASDGAPPAAPAQPPGHARRPTDWARDTSGFGLTQPPPMVRPGAAPPATGAPAAPPTERRRGWLARWRPGDK